MSLIEGCKVDVLNVHISTIKAGDTVYHDGKLRTVSRCNISNSSFMGTLLFGDSYHGGRKGVKRVVFKNAIQAGQDEK